MKHTFTLLTALLLAPLAARNGQFTECIHLLSSGCIE